MKRMFAWLMAICLMLGMMPAVAAAEYPDCVARVGETEYQTLKEAVAAAVESGETVEIFKTPAEDDIAVVDKCADFLVWYLLTADFYDHILAGDGLKLYRSGSPLVPEGADYYVLSYSFCDCDITFDRNGGKSYNDENRVRGAVAGERFRLPGKYLYTAPKGMQFKAWEYDGKLYGATDWVTFTSDATVKAIWTVITEQKVEETFETYKVPESLKNNEELNLDTPEKIANKMTEDIVTSPKVQISVEQSKVIDVCVTTKQGNEVGNDDIPVDGVVITIPYPAGTSRETHNFVVGHMITDGANVGDIEYPLVTETNDGIQFTLKSFSPVCIGWSKDMDAYRETIAYKAAPWYPMILMVRRMYPVTVMNNEGGTVTSADAYKYGKSMTYTITPDEGYSVASVVVDGTEIGAVTEYTFDSLKNGHRMVVIFEKNA